MKAATCDASSVLRRTMDEYSAAPAREHMSSRPQKGGRVDRLGGGGAGAGRDADLEVEGAAGGPGEGLATAQAGPRRRQRGRVEADQERREPHTLDHVVDQRGAG